MLVRVDETLVSELPLVVGEDLGWASEKWGDRGVREWGKFEVSGTLLGEEEVRAGIRWAGGGRNGGVGVLIKGDEVVTVEDIERDGVFEHRVKITRFFLGIFGVGEKLAQEECSSRDCEAFEAGYWSDEGFFAIGRTSSEVDHNGLGRGC